MHQIIVIAHNSKANAALFFKTKISAEIAHKAIYDAQKGSLPVQVLKIEDDFGCIMTMDKENICYAMFMDGDKQSELAMMMGGKRPTLIPEA